MACSFSYLISCLWFCLALTKAYYCDSNIDDDNLDPSFAPKSFLVQADHRLAVSCIWKTNFLLRQSTRHRLAASSPNCYWLLPWLAGDIEANPGPVRFPCRRCDRPVKCNQKGIQCDVCYDWLHVRCINMSESEYYLLGNSDTPWCCPDCWSEALLYHDVSGLSDISISTPSQPVHQPVFHSNPSHSSPSASSLNSLSKYYANCRSILPKLDAL